MADISPERRARRTARDINWGLIAGAGVQQPRAFNDPVVDCCGRDAANCDCPTHHLVSRSDGRGGSHMVCKYCKRSALELGRDATQLGCPKGPR